MKNEKKPKIAILSIRNSYGFGGVFSTLRVVHDFCQRYFDPTVFYLSFDSEISAHVQDFQFTSSNRANTFFGMKCIEVGSRWAFWEPGHYAFTKDQWEEALKDFDYFFVVSATPLAGHPLALLDKKFLIWISTSYVQDRNERVKHLSGLRWLIDTIAQPAMRTIERSILTKATHIISLSSYSKSEFSKSLGSTKDNMSICGYPLDTTHAPKTTKNFREKIIIAVGRFSDPRKNIAMLLRSFGLIHAAHPDARLIVIGKEPDVSLMEGLENLASHAAVTFVGQIGHADLRHFYETASLMLVTSYQEGFGVAALEGAFYGAPIITTDCGGPRDFVINNYNGYIVKNNDAHEMALHAIELLSDPVHAQEFSYNGHHLTQSLFREEKVFSHFKNSLIKVYPELSKLFRKVDLAASQQPTQKSSIQEASL